MTQVNFSIEEDIKSNGNFFIKKYCIFFEKFSKKSLTNS